MIIKTPIIPVKQTFSKKRNVSHDVNLEAICVFLATGFFLDNDTYWKDQVCLASAHNHTIDEQGFLIDSKPWFNWHYTPRNITFESALSEYKDLLTTIITEQVGDSPVILPLSGGLDSRSQAMILKDLKNPVHAYSYSFDGGYPEHKIAKEIAKVCDFSFQNFFIPKSYLWDCIGDLSEINDCYSEFTHPRQMAVLPELKKMQGVFSLGHWGDVLFDRGVPEGAQEKDVLPFLLKKMIKPKGVELAEKLWQTWGLDGRFEEYLVARIETSLARIKIDNLSAKVRAFKTSQWAHRWTTTNLSVFEAAHPITLPYYDNRMCEFICTIPEEYLADRRLQLAHLKQDKVLAGITWQDQTPFSIQNYHYNKIPYNLPYRVLNKFKREASRVIGNPYIQRNWELQFVGDYNAKQLEGYIFDKDFNSWISKTVVREFYQQFKNTDTINYSHPISMLLTLALWHSRNFNLINA